MTRRRRVDVNLDELDQIIDRGRRAPLSESEGEKLKTALHAMAERLLRKRSTEKASAVLPPDTAPAGKPDAGESAPVGHGRNPAAAFRGANRIAVAHPTLHSGDTCPECRRGKVYCQKEPATLVRFVGHAPLEATVFEIGWSTNQIALQARTGQWWFVTGPAIRRFPDVSFGRLARTRPEAVYALREGFNRADIWHVFEDSRGDIWTGSHREAASTSGISRWSRDSGSFHHYASAEMPGIPMRSDRPPTAFAEDRSGNVWIAVDYGVLARYREGQFDRITASGLLIGWTEALYCDRAGRIWIADEEYGLARIDNPGTDHPSFVRYGTGQGLSSNSIRCITGDRFGRIYVGAGSGVDRLDPSTGQVEHYTRGDGLVRGDVVMGFCDRYGALWFGTRYGVSRFIPEQDRAAVGIEVRVSGLRVRGSPRAISDLGELMVSKFPLAPNQNQVEIEFDGLGFASGDQRYQYMLEGSDRDWNPPTLQRTVNYASLSSGSYRFLVRAVNAGGFASSEPATIAFQVLPPLWRRWWFVTLAALAFVSAIHMVYRFRLGRLLELERIRTSIARDLHDDIGASLSQIALLSEVLVRQAGEDKRSRGSLEQIGAMARELVDSMSDIVWSVNPRRDTVGDLTQRMRAFANDAFLAGDMDFQFRAPSGEDGMKLSIDLRRQVFLIFKETVNNVVRHSHCTQVEIDFNLDKEWLALRVGDNGRGFQRDSSGHGHGLPSMENRAQSLNGDLRINSGPEGTAVSLRIPLTRRMSWRRRFLHE